MAQNERRRLQQAIQREELPPGTQMNRFAVAHQAVNWSGVAEDIDNQVFLEMNGRIADDFEAQS